MYEDLNPNQRKAVLTNSKKVLVMAGAGSGKTKVLTTRIHYLLSNNISFKDIAAFTFTNKAARNMKLKLEVMLKDKKDDIPIISTFHSYCYSFISLPEFYVKLGFSNRPTVILESDKSNIIKDILLKYKDDYSNIPFIKNISRVKNGAEIIDILPKDTLIFNKVYFEYQEVLRKSNAIDFDDMIPLFIELCKKDELILDLVQLKYVLVDECQDINKVQYELINILSNRYKNVFMVGDEDQLIYSFRSSDIAILKEFESTCDETIILNENYRCNKEILKHANKLIKYNSDRLKKELFSQIDNLNNVEFREFMSQSDEAIYVADKIKELVNTGLHYKDIAVLYRNNNQSIQIEKELNRLNIPYQLFGGKPFFEYKEISTIIYTYRLLYDPKNEIALRSIYNYNHKIEIKEFNIFMLNYHKANTASLIDYASNYNFNEDIKQLGLELKTLKEEMDKLNQSDFFMKVLEVLHYNKYLKISNEQKPQYARIMALKDMVDNIDDTNIIDAFNEMILDNTFKPINNEVSLLTIHKAKGLEFEVVFVIGFNEGILPSYNKKGKDLEEERRLAYVAITRAKQQLFLYCSIIHYANGNLAKRKPSSFLVEAEIKEAEVMKFFGNYWYNH